MSNLAQFTGGYGPLSSITNYFSAGGTIATTNLTASPANNLKQTLSGALTAGVLSSALINVTGRGRVNLLNAYMVDSTIRTVRLQVIIDGVTVFDATSNSSNGVGYGIVAVGSVDQATGAHVFQPVEFYESLVVKVASSLTETNKLAVGINYETWA